MTQHALILTLRDMFCDKLSYDSSQEKTIKCYAQDPIYNDSDIGALASLDITVLDDPDGFLQLDEETAVISIAPNICVKQVVTELSRPALIFWNLTEKGKTEEEMLEMKLYVQLVFQILSINDVKMIHANMLLFPFTELIPLLRGWFKC